MASIWNWLEKVKKIKDEKLTTFRYYVIKHTPGAFFKVLVDDLISIFILSFKFITYSLLTIVILWIWHKNFPFSFRAFSYYIPLFNDIACNIPYIGDSQATMEEIYKATTETKITEMANEFDQIQSQNNPTLNSTIPNLYETARILAEGHETRFKGFYDRNSGSNYGLERKIHELFIVLTEILEYVVKLRQHLEGDYVPRLLDVLNNGYGLVSPHTAKLTVDDLYVLYPSLLEWINGLKYLEELVNQMLYDVGEFAEVYKEHVDNFNKKHKLPKRIW